MSSNIIKGKEAIEGMMRGVSAVTDLIRPTYGGKGSNVIVESKLRPFHQIANDAWTIVSAIQLKDPAEKRGLDFIKELCERADKMSGDARKTTILLCEEILKAGYEADINKLELKRELDKLIPFIESEIDKQTKQITVDEVSSVATTATENQEMGALLQEIYQKIGKDGIIHPEGSGTFETSYKFIEGVRFFNTGYLSPSMVHDEQAKKDKVQETRAVYEKPLILVTKKKITTDDDINPLLREMQQIGEKDLVIFTQDMDSGVASMLVDLHKKGTFNILIIKAPSLWRDYVYEDFAKCVGATIIEDASGKTLKTMSLSDLGTCGKLIVDEDETQIIGTKDISAHIARLQEKGDDDSRLRLSWLVNKSAILKIGANSETDLSYKRLKTHDGIRSSQSALQYGVVRGGGLCLASVAENLPETIAGKVLAQALKFPRSMIVFNSQTLEVPENVVDSAYTVKQAVRNAIGIASTILTANGYVYIPELTPAEMAYKISMNKQYDF